MGSKEEMKRKDHGPFQTVEIGDHQREVDARLKEWGAVDLSHRFWGKDHTLWANDPSEITDRLGWLFLPEKMHDRLDEMESFAKGIRQEGFKDVVLLGMGGSSLAPEVYQKVFGNAPGYPSLTVLDSTHPGAVSKVEAKIDLSRTLFLFSSKSGTTLEPMSFFRYFWSRVSEISDEPGGHFVAITDPGTSLEGLAKEKGFRRVFNATSDLGGRYSALTAFGLVPAALIGMDIHEFLGRAREGQQGCASSVPVGESSGFILGAVLGEMALAGRDKVSFLASPSVDIFPDWLEQLIAESTGKDGKGLVPIVNVPRVPAGYYGDDRLFVYFSLEGEVDLETEGFFNELKDAGHPTVRIVLRDRYDIAREIFRWEVAVASAGAVMGIHPFNQPDVETAKDLARKVMDSEGSMDEGGIKTISPGDEGAIMGFLGGSRKGDYVSIHAYLAPDDGVTDLIQNIRLNISRRYGVATTMGYGPRFLHSTGQLHKGGPNTGLFIQFVDEPAEGLDIPGTGYSFRSLVRSQATGDYLAMGEKDRRVLRIDLGPAPLDGLERILGFTEDGGQ